jgi:hypothetical protein
LAERDGKFLTVTLGSGIHTLTIAGETSPYIQVIAEVNNDGVLRLGRTGQITVKAIDERNDSIDLSGALITYASGDESVATVSAAGVISTVGAGRTSLAVRVKKGDLEGLASVSVRVTDAPFAGDDKIQTVELRLNALEVGETATPTTVGIFGDGSEIVFDNVTYTSANENIAQVNANGTVTRLAEGKFTLKAATGEHFEKLDPAFDFSRFEITPVYSNDFSDGVNPFTGVTTNMSVGNGQLFVGKSTNAIYEGGTDWTDYILTATINPVPETGSPIAPGGPAATFHFRANSSRSQLYMWQIFSGNYLKKHINISETGSVTTAIDGMKPAGQDNQIAIAAEGNRIMTYINGKLADMAEYTNYSQGTVGVRTGSYEEFYVDNLVVGTRRLVTVLTVDSGTTGLQPANVPPVNIIVEKRKIQATFEGSAAVKFYSVTGVLLDATTANGIYTCNAPQQGVYILSVDEKPYKVVVR